MCVLGWQLSLGAVSLSIAQSIQALAMLNYPSTYQAERWHVTLIALGIASVALAFNVFFYRQLPFIETVMAFLHVGGWLAIVITLFAMGRSGSRSVHSQEVEAVFFTFTDGGGWGNQGVSALVGILTPIGVLACMDSTVHMAEEVRDASRTLPRILLGTFFVNGLAAFVMLLAFCLVIGNDPTGETGSIDALLTLSLQTSQPWPWVFYWATGGSRAGATVMALVVILALLCAAVNAVATGSRQLWAFARDKGVPFSGWFSVVHPRWDLPVNALIFTFGLNALLLLINVGSLVALNIINSLTLSALLSASLISIGCLAAKRLRGEDLLPASFLMGKMGLPINLLAVGFLSLGLLLVSLVSLHLPG